MDLRQQLREETKEAHQLLDTEVGKLAIFQIAAEYSVYLTSLHKLYAAYANQVDWVSDQAGLTRCVGPLQKAIESDCRRVDGDWQPVVADLVASESSMTPASCWGAAYVLEGSAMGARYMVKHAQSSSLVVGGQIQLSYLKQLSDDSYHRWPAFIAALEEAKCDPDATVTASRETFRTAMTIFSNAIQQYRRAKLGV